MNVLKKITREIRLRLSSICLLPVGLVYIMFFHVACGNHPDMIIGIKIYENKEDPNALFSKWKEIGINTAFISKELTLDNNFRNSLVKANIPFYIIWPVFQNPAALKNDSSLFAITDQGLKAKDDWVEFVCPSRSAYRNLQTDSIIWYVKNFNPDGISLDFIRQFVFWEMVYPDRDPTTLHNTCYCDSCLENFTEQYTCRFPDSLKTIQQKSLFVKKHYQQEWNRFRSEQITSFVRDISANLKRINPDIKINVHIVPWRDSDFNGAIINIAGQDIQSLAKYVDYVSPMCYSQMVKHNAAWISSVVKDMDHKAPGKVIPSIQVYPYYINYPFPIDSLEKCISASLKMPSNGVIFWSWPLLIKDQKREDMVSKYLKKGI